MPSAAGYGDPLTRNDIGLFLLRVAVGLVVCLHGLQKFFGFGEGGVQFSQLGPTLAQSGWKQPDLAALMVAGSESIGGALMITGLLTPVGACAVMATMIDAWLENQWAHPGLQFFGADGALEYTFVLAAAAAAVLLLGPGRMSVDGRLGRDEWPTALSYGLMIVGIGASIATWVLLKGANPFR